MVGWEVALLALGFILLITAIFNRPPLVYFILSFVAFGAFYYRVEAPLVNFLLFMISIILLIVELYIPDFGLVGILGIFGTVYSLHLLYPDISTLIILLVGLLFISLLTGFIHTHRGKSLTLSPGFVLKNSATRAEGYQSNKDFSFLLGERGIADSNLRPVGRAIINNEYYEVMSQEDFIAEGVSIVVVNVQGSNIYVRKDEING